MNKKTLKALKGSIKKWEKIEARTEEDKGVSNCPLCRVFFSYNCHNCPVKNRTGFASCKNTPYDKWELHQHVNHYSKRVVCKWCKKYAKDEVEFLKSLLLKDAETIRTQKA